MKAKILKAIDRGLLNVLSTDIEDQNIDFDTSDINNEYNPEISLDELYDIFNENKKSIFIEKYDTTNAISLILDDDSEISLYQYEEGMNPIFIKISNDDLKKGNNEILIYVPDNHLISGKKLEWQTKYEQIQDDTYIINYEKHGDGQKNVANKDFNGYTNCKRITDITSTNKKLVKTTAIKYCMKQNEYGHQGYLPSMGQLRIMSDYLDLINYVLQKVGQTNELEINSGYWWSSTENSNYYAWYLSNGTTTNITNKTHNLSVLPIFVLKIY